jgi:hypothetical protein
MPLATLAQTIQVIIAPVVMVTACGLILGGLLTRYAGINDRMRLMAHERWELVRALGGGGPTAGPPADPFVAERIHEIDIQLPQLLRRHHRLRDAAVLLYLAVLVFIGCMFLIASAAVFELLALTTAALWVFLLGNGLLLLGVLQTAIEVTISHRALYYEMQRVLDLGRPPSS